MNTTNSLFFFSEVAVVCWFSHVNNVAFAITKLIKTSAYGWHCALNSTGQTRSQSFNAEKSSSGDKSSVQCIVFFNLVKFSIHLKKITHLKKFSLKRNWEKMKNLDSFCKSLSAYQVNFSVQTWEGKISACFSLNLDYPDW